MGGAGGRPKQEAGAEQGRAEGGGARVGWLRGHGVGVGPARKDWLQPIPPTPRDDQAAGCGRWLHGCVAAI